jgi:hypothetical protein
MATNELAYLKEHGWLGVKTHATYPAFQPPAHSFSSCDHLRRRSTPVITSLMEAPTSGSSHPSTMLRPATPT